MTNTGRAKQIFNPEFQFGLGGVPLGNEFEVVTDEDAMKTMEASWNAGVRYFDVSPLYGLGLAERRYGMFLRKQPRDSYLISTKVGKLLKASPHNNSKDLFPYGNSPNNVVFDYTADGVSGPRGIAIDPSGNLWITNFTYNSITEFLGIAAPTATPITASTHGQRP